jgi:hypothetical protein
MSKKWQMVLLIFAVILIALIADFYSRCHGKPLSREEAVERADTQLKYLARDFVLGEPLPVLTSEQYDSTSRTWTLDFRNSTCEVSIIADRCHGTDVGGLSAGCTKRTNSR